ncbi:ribbon-helix-helix protein, CopG family [Leptospira stimsonii]|uniref:Ribbon-helix-helix protein, CopG family n=1 Tax=Leptospira stimsonii TaxID=2202203 RepID=A0ABY2NAQ5_9LEPT|nr:ribbon-helix-helix protein, CopG family [Leptospira stimsonii]TGK17614.1 ribbon-helix-helix protein, CopG family [Leptospira stimsonii]TGM20259.1 ribbon-helix-helix protein, CopG family [Leptospira stimsonii]
MISLRLPPELEKKLSEVAKIENKSKSEVIKESLVYYIDNFAQKPSAYELGKKYFGQYKSGISDKSVNHQKYIKDVIQKKKKVNDKSNY